MSVSRQSLLRFRSCNSCLSLEQDQWATVARATKQEGWELGIVGKLGIWEVAKWNECVLLSFCPCPSPFACHHLYLSLSLCILSLSLSLSLPLFWTLGSSQILKMAHFRCCFHRVVVAAVVASPRRMLKMRNGFGACDGPVRWPGSGTAAAVQPVQEVPDSRRRIHSRVSDGGAKTTS